MTTTVARRPSTASRRAGYVVAAVINAVLLWLIHVWPGWDAVPFLTSDFATVLWLIDLSLVVTIALNLLYLIRRPAMADRGRGRRHHRHRARRGGADAAGVPVRLRRLRGLAGGRPGRALAGRRRRDDRDHRKPAHPRRPGTPPDPDRRLVHRSPGCGQERGRPRSARAAVTASSCSRSSTSSRCTSTPRRVSRRSAIRSRGSTEPGRGLSGRRVEQAGALQVGDVLAGAPGRSRRAGRPRAAPSAAARGRGGRRRRAAPAAASSATRRSAAPARPARRRCRGRRRPRRADSPGAAPGARRSTGGPPRRPSRRPPRRPAGRRCAGLNQPSRAHRGGPVRCRVAAYSTAKASAAPGPHPLPRHGQRGRLVGDGAQAARRTGRPPAPGGRRARRRPSAAARLIDPATGLPASTRARPVSGLLGCGHVVIIVGTAAGPAHRRQPPSPQRVRRGEGNGTRVPPRGDAGETGPCDRRPHGRPHPPRHPRHRR